MKNTSKTTIEDCTAVQRWCVVHRCLLKLKLSTRPQRSALTFGWKRHHIRRELRSRAPTNPGMSARNQQSKGAQNHT